MCTWLCIWLPFTENKQGPLVISQLADQMSTPGQQFTEQFPCWYILRDDDNGSHSMAQGQLGQYITRTRLPVEQWRKILPAAAAFHTLLSQTVHISKHFAFGQSPSPIPKRKHSSPADFVEQRTANYRDYLNTAYPAPFFFFFLRKQILKNGLKSDAPLENHSSKNTASSSFLAVKDGEHS